jgi:hypothetical protein
VLHLLILPNSTAQAHGAANSPASNYVSKITSVSPVGKTFSIAIIEATSRVELRWNSGDGIVVPDYDGFAYLRIGPRGVEENQQSFASYINRDRQGATNLPSGLRPEGRPEWKFVSSEPVARWHDHRIHWMGTVDPDGVSANRKIRQTVQDFQIDVKQGSTTYAVRGKLEWVPGPNPIPYLIMALIIAVLLIGTAAWVGVNEKRKLQTRLPMGVAALLLLVVDALHLSGIAFGIRGPTSKAIGRIFSVGFMSIVGWLVLLVAALLISRRRFDGYYLLTFGAGLVFVIGGLSDVNVLSRTSIPFAFATTLARVAIATTLGLGIGLVVAGILLTRRSVFPSNSELETGPEESLPRRVLAVEHHERSE